MPKQRSFSQFDGGAGTAAARRGKKVASKSPRAQKRTSSGEKTGNRAQEIVDSARSETKARLRRTLRLGID